MKRIIMLLPLMLFVYNASSQLLVHTDDELSQEQTDSLMLMAAATLESNLNSLNSLNVIPPSPQSQIFDRVYIDHPMAEYYGLPDISIPLGEISIKGVDIPIVLSYHAGGVKYLQYDGEIAAGWSLNLGGYRITRTIKGKSDFLFPTLINPQSEFLDIYYYQQSNDNLWRKENYLARAWCKPNPHGDSENMWLILTDNAPNGYEKNYSWWIDPELDQFAYNLPTTNGHFTINWKDPSGFGRNMGLLREKLAIKNDKGFIIDNNGNRFDFGGDEDLVEVTYMGDKGGATEVPYHNTAWALNKITNPFGEEITFSYTTENIKSSRTEDEYISLSIKSADQSCYPRTNVEPDNPHIMSWAEVFQPSKGGKFGRGITVDTTTPVLSKVETPNCTIIIHRTPTNDQTGNSVSLISSIEIKYGTFVRKIIFDQKKYPQNPTGKQPWHYLLESLKITDNKGNVEKEYSFDYYKKNEVPTAFPYPDQWGYYCFGGKDKLNLHPELRNVEFLSYSETFDSNRERIQSLNDMGTYSNYFTTRDTASSLQNIFSLKSVKYPTGGRIEYEYESHIYYDKEQARSMKGGGLRVKTISTYESDDDISPLIANYVYTNGEPSFSISSDNFQTMTHVLSVVGRPYPYHQTSLTYWEIKTFSMYPTGDIPWNDFKVAYPKVDVVKSRKTGNNMVSEGKIISTYKIPVTYEVSPFFSIFGKDRIININPPSNLVNPIVYKNPWNTYSPKNCDINVSKYMFGYKPEILTRTVFNNNNDTVRFEKYEYLTIDEPLGSGVKISKKLDWNNHVTPLGFNINNLRPTEDIGYWLLRYGLYHVNSFFEWMPYEIRNGKYLLKSQEIKDYDIDGGYSTTTSESYEYDYDRRLNQKSVKNSNEQVYREKYYYPYSNSTLYDKNMLSTVLEKVAYNIHQYDNVEIERIKQNYVQGGLMPINVQTSYSGIYDLKVSTSYDAWDEKGNIRAYTDDTGLKTVVLWSYNYSYPIAIIKNASWEEVTQHISADRLKQTAGFSSLDYQYVEELDELRSKLPQSQITTYTYMPGAGIKTVTDPRGVITNYDYDTFGRLISAGYKGNYHTSNQTYLEEYEYNYREQ